MLDIWNQHDVNEIWWNNQVKEIQEGSWMLLIKLKKPWIN